MGEFNNKITLIAGAAGGIGLTAAQAFSNEGAKVILVDTNRDSIQHIRKKFAQRVGKHRASPQISLIFSDCEAKAMASHAVETCGGLHIAFNNARIPCSSTVDFEDYDINEWNHVMSVNLNGIFYSIKAGVPSWKNQVEQPSLIQHQLWILWLQQVSHLSISSKHVVAGLTKTASMDLIKRGVHINSICLGFTEIPMLAHKIAMPEARKNTDPTAPIGRITTSNEVTQAVFFASEKASYKVGAPMLIDGGVTIP